jgi:heme-degrading monooxygenase HmoA
MFIAMNRFKIAPGFEAGFEQIWRERDSYLSEVPGFRSFALLKGSKVEVADGDDYVLYASHSIWESRAAFEAWTESDHFRKAHAQTSAPKGTYLGHPNLETFEQVL